MEMAGLLILDGGWMKTWPSVTFLGEAIGGSFSIRPTSATDPTSNFTEYLRPKIADNATFTPKSDVRHLGALGA